ncbi:prolyl 3-hydroxylase OGFOD1-like [Antedon mediterranea]|uniref:prolyl 3-hydroxylase OGFOD1-like n=1 Tax=Antedon mediterranea TaxID=105859 RepID=UPI003AF98027
MNSKRGEVHLSKDDEFATSKHKSKKKFKSSKINSRVNQIYFEKELMQKFNSSFNERKGFLHDETDAQIHSDPFTCCVLPNFIENDEFTEDLQDELLNLDFVEKSNDLYKFHQSQALQNISNPNITALKNLLYKDFTKWLTSVTNISFTETVDMTCAKYEYTDTLLCHDDELEGRRIAFIYYLVPPWNEEDGGSLDLFDVDDVGQPNTIARSLFPKFNNLVFFEVNPVSFHQVAEVLSKNKCRLSVSGWFHAKTLARPPPFVEPRKIRTSHQEVKEEMFYDWINPLYLDLENQTEIMDRFQDDSEIQLEGFLAKDKYQSLCEALSNQKVKWKRIGPANKRQYEIAEQESLPPVVQECLSVMKSEMMFLLLSNFTALKLHALAPDQDSSDDEEDLKDDKQDPDDDTDPDKPEDKEIKAIEEPSSSNGSNETSKTCNKVKQGQSSMKTQREASDNKIKDKTPSCHGDVRRWRHGDYTLLHDTDTEGSEFALDAVLYFNCKDWDNEYGGFTSYLAKGEDEELLSVTPKENCLSLVYRDKDTLRFVKHINHKVTELADGATSFHDIAFVYYE